MSSTTPYPIPRWEGVVTDVQREFIRPLQTPLAGFRLFAGRTVQRGNWWNFHIQSWKTSDVDGSFMLTRDVPPFRANAAGNITPEEDPLPMMTWDYGWGGREGRQMEEVGLDAEFIQEMGRGWARSINKLLLTGTGDATKFGPEKGLFDIAGSTVTGGNWTDPDTLDKDLLDAMENISDRGEEYADSSFRLVMDPSDRSLIGARVPNTSPTRRVAEDLPLGITGPVLWDSNVGTGNAYVVSEAQGAGYNILTPRPDPQSGMNFGLGRANIAGIERDGQGTLIGNRAEMMDSILMQKKVRIINIMGVRFSRRDSGDSPVEKITFTR